MLTKATVRTNGFSYLVQGTVNKETKTFSLHVGTRYRTEMAVVPNIVFNSYPRRVDRQEASNIKKQVVSNLLGETA